jgi:hypothetical protein
VKTSDLKIEFVVTFMGTYTSLTGSDSDRYVIVMKFQYSIVKDFRYLKGGGKLRYIKTGLFFRKVACTDYDVLWPIECRNVKNDDVGMWSWPTLR